MDKLRMTIPTSLESLRFEMKTSRFKIRLRAGLFLLFGSLFTIYFIRDIANQYFTWGWAAILFAIFVPAGSLLSRIVPMRFDMETGAVILSLDRTYLILVWLLVTAKVIASRTPALITLSDVIMCAILGIMFGRLGGIGLRVRALKMRYDFHR